jgi:hypothetical protein
MPVALSLTPQKNSRGTRQSRVHRFGARFIFCFFPVGGGGRFDPWTVCGLIARLCLASAFDLMNSAVQCWHLKDLIGEASAQVEEALGSAEYAGA